MNIGYSNIFHIILCKLTTLGCCSIWATIMIIRQCLYLFVENNDGATLESYYIIMSNDFNIHSTMPLNKLGKIVNNFDITGKIASDREKIRFTLLFGFCLSTCTTPYHSFA